MLRDTNLQAVDASYRNSASCSYGFLHRRSFLHCHVFLPRCIHQKSVQQLNRREVNFTLQ